MTLPPQNKLEHFCRLNPDVRVFLRVHQRITLCFGIILGTLVCIVIRFLSA
jgi:hypothetical protein